MFDFEKFPVYLQSEKLYHLLTKDVFSKNFNKNLKDQLQRASSSILLNIAEWAGKYSKADKKNYYLTARWSVHECVAILRILRLDKIIWEENFSQLYVLLEEISKMLSGLINTLLGK